MNVTSLRPQRPWRCRLGLHRRQYRYEDFPHPLTPMVRQHWLIWTCILCGAEGSDLHDYEVKAEQGGTVAVALVVAGAILVTVLGGILDTV